MLFLPYNGTHLTKLGVKWPSPGPFLNLFGSADQSTICLRMGAENVDQKGR